MILQKCEHGQREQLQAINGCMKLGIPWRISSEVGDADECHVGTVEWCQEALGFTPRPDFYPDWLSEHFKRLVIRRHEEFVVPSGGRVFAKPSWAYKQSPAKIFEQGECVPELWIMSEVVTFTQEWRYYVANGELLAAGWYDGPGEETPAPQLDIAWPKGFCGAVDFGRLDTGEIALVESHHPYACGNYLEADECEAWVMWLELGWEWTLKEKPK